MEIINEIIQGLIDTSALEWAGVIIGTFYLIFIARKNRFGWLFAMVSTSIYIYLTYSVGLYIESGLQIFYFVMAIHGWASWNKTPSEKRLIIKWPIKYHIINILVSSVVTLLLGFIMAKYTDQKSPYLDAFS